ncbi:hypothetical protein N7448_002014 [Penicillium atrosanguineum]|uniref:Uncharacterized protein n=1 Tax=Penicillium atrosanguineum TaxID=1132637 RepID=A0A9W9HCX0_9EURO|nr:Amidase [Penicillium atrosanguineum]KAJ5128296.1 hypothetical protein N7526_006462 [Penicillium atrosanguineum]KAJ5144622.1 hypothetical protein N7448_002014 [Penicillium atrosanguineum]KAJ5300413.1 Amidase [Penicillium atrosanguineum]KAJ5311051.1 hypothetical protein N7476_006911 [Penicillium atrosanguineum]
MENPRPSRVEKSRPAKACNTCRRKKVKCDGKRPVCSSCIIFKLPCGFENNGTQSRRTSRAYVDELEQRVKCMEDQLQRLSRCEKLPQQSVPDFQSPSPATGLLKNLGVDNSDLGDEGNLLADARSPDDEAFQAGRDTSDQPSYVLRAQDGRMRFFGASSGFGVQFSQEASRPMVKQPKLGWEHTARRSAVQWPLTNWIPRILQDSFEERTTQPLPSKEATLSLVADFLANFNRTIPLVDDTSLMRLVKRQFSWNPDDSPSSWVLLNVVMAFSYRERAQTSADASDDWHKSLGHIKNALNVVVDLFLRNADLPAVQGLLGLALYFQGTPNAQALFMLAASAMRLSHSIGLHRNTTSGFTKTEIEERRRTFWISFIMDADISLRVGRPPVQDMEDYNTPLPAEAPHDGRGIIFIDGTRINFFRTLAQFAIVQRRTYRHLQTVAVIQQPKEIAFMSAKACEEALLLWKSSIPDIFRPEHLFASEPIHSRQHILRLNLAYHCCYANLRQLSLATSYANNTSHDQPEVDKEITALCLRSIDSARSALAMLPYVRLLGSNHRWNMLYFFATASVALSSEIRINPNDQSSNDDLTMVHEVTAFLTDVSCEEPGTFVDFILGVCSDLEISARRTIHQARSDATKPAIGIHENVDLPDVGLSDQQQPAGHSDNSLFNNEVDLTHTNQDSFNAQWSIPPFWNWQDMFVGMPSSPDMNRARTNEFT